MSALVGFDGFIDVILDVVERRESADAYTRLRTIGEFSRLIAGAAGRSANFELVARGARFGGNGPLLASGLAGLGLGLTYIGAVGDGEAARTIHPTFGPFAARCRRVIPIGVPAHTDALEFEDGKLMLGQSACIQRIAWRDIADRVGLGTMREIVRGAAIIGLVNWVMMPGAEGIWEGLCADVLAEVPACTPAGDPRRVIVDLADPAKRSDDDLRRALGILRRMQGMVPVTLGLNLSEAERVAGAVGVPWGRRSGVPAERLRAMAESLHRRLGLDSVVIHPREGAAGCDAGGAAWFDGPMTPSPRLSTGAGDHFNAGFIGARAAGLALAESIAVACATSGAYVRDAGSPTLARVASFLDDLPLPGED